MRLLIGSGNLEKRFKCRVGDFVLEARAVAVCGAGAHLHLDNGLRMLAATDEIGLPLLVGDDEAERQVYRQQIGAAKFERCGGGLPSRLATALAAALRLVEKGDGRNGGEHRDSCPTDAVQVNAPLQKVAVEPANGLDSGQNLYVGSDAVHILGN